MDSVLRARNDSAERKVKILLVDDQQANLLGLDAILEDLGQHHVTARSGEEALERLEEDDYAVILLDVVMPGIDGYETARIIRSRARTRYTPIIFLSAYGQGEMQNQEAYALGAVDLLVKPLVPAALRAKVQTFVQLFRKNAELKQIATELQQSNQELEQFAYVASHDLKEPLRKIRIYLQLLEERCLGRLDAETKEFLHYAVDGAQRMHRLIDDLLAFARAGSRRKPLASADCGAAFDQAVANLEPDIRSRSAVVTRGKLPTMVADQEQLTQLFGNLISNGIKFQNGQSVPKVHAEAVHQPNAWRFTVRDNGIGIDPQYNDRIFVLFQRLHSQNEYPGTGIGLAICKKIVERLGGSIGVDSKPGEGATFWFTLPNVEDFKR
jgi:signal transduction histidine kinase